MRKIPVFGLILASFILTSCLYYPDTYHTLEADHLNQPFNDCWAVNDPGIFSFSIGDTARDLRKLRVISYSFHNQDGKLIPIFQVTYDKTHDKYRTIIQFHYDPNTFAAGTPFSAAIDFEIDGEKASLIGDFSEHAHTKIEYLPEVLDHG